MRLHLNVEPQEHAATEHALKVAARLDADALDHLASLAHEDALLTLALDVHRGMQAQQIALGALELIADHADGMGDLLARAQQDLLAHELGDHDLIRLVGAHALGEPTRALGQKACHHVHERLDIEALRGGDHDLVIEVHQGTRRLELLEHLLGTGQVRLGKDEHLGRLGGSHALGNPGVAAADRGARIDHEGDHVHVGELAQSALVELGAKAVLGLVDAGRVHNHELAVLAVDHGAQTAARGLGHRRGNGNLLTVAGVQQRGLARVGTAHQGDESGAEALGHIRAAGHGGKAGILG